ncbi:mini-chromosome maintenance replisome factor-domain-containing protein [Irpex rosettiformis]|uniref:Mini-chromosome maintenance replisome factor-domain-containing protein n=1 Tax=Irpex rosettiformis TaxID=378272 RepID=A0ACB8TTX9_9APHY|nr:mini-chromosome maintenance replisome factor-domain-containing protein [Irpex rosettiformis]
MVSAYFADALRDPTSELQELYARASTSQDFPSEVARHFSRVFSTDDTFREIPVLDVHNPPESYSSRQLVRFRAMIQDTSPSSEMYLRRTTGGTLGGWGIHSNEDEEIDIDYNELRECNILWAVSVPGESTWCGIELDGSITPSQSIHKPLRSHKHPDSDGRHIGVQIKMYDTAVAEHFKPTEVVTFVGILTNEPLHSDGDHELDVPTLHVFFARHHPHSAITRAYPFVTRSEESTAIKTRERLIKWIADQSLGGDVEAAEWVLLTIIARVQSRHPPLLPPTLTISHFPPPPTTESLSPPAAIPSLSDVLSALLPLARTLPLSLDFLNKTRFAPESKEEDLHSGALQIPQGSVLLITEHGVQEGKLVEQGLVNIGTLQEVMNSQTLAYRFLFSQFSFPTDITCIVLTEGKKSAFFKTDIVIPLKFDPESLSTLYKPASDILLPDVKELEAFRDLVVGSRAGKVQVTEATSQHIQQDFVNDRRQNPAITSDDLIRRMTIAKLYALSLHEIELSIDTWERAKALDERRKARLV